MHKSFNLLPLIFFLLFFSTPAKTFAKNEILQDDIIIDQLHQISPIQEKTIPSIISIPTPEPKIIVDRSIKRSEALRLTIDSNLIDFGELTPTNPLIRTQIISVTNLLSPLYDLLIYENHPLTNPTGSFIPNTTCDSGGCTEFTSGVWDSTLTFGLGYRCENIEGYDCENGFNYDQTYKQIPENKDKMSISIMEGINDKNSKSINISFKLNTSASQQSGPYTNIVTYTLTPSF